MPDNLDNYQTTLVRSILSAKPVTPHTKDAVRAALHKQQAEMLTELVTSLLEHYDAQGYSPITLLSALVTALLRWSKERKPQP